MQATTQAEQRRAAEEKRHKENIQRTKMEAAKQEMNGRLKLLNECCGCSEE